MPEFCLGHPAHIEDVNKNLQIVPFRNLRLQKYISIYRSIVLYCLFYVANTITSRYTTISKLKANSEAMFTALNRLTLPF
jgi:hypothetical protein